MWKYAFLKRHQGICGFYKPLDSFICGEFCGFKGDKMTDSGVIVINMLLW